MAAITCNELAVTLPPYIFRAGTAPLLISIPHLGTDIPTELAVSMTPAALRVPDTDWHLDRLYAFADALGASVLGGRYSRYVIDLNRPPDDESLYPGQTKTGLCPTTSFRGAPLYLHDAAVDGAEQADRLRLYWRPYHAQLAAELARLKAQHGQVLLWEAHSIASVLPRLFDGKLPDMNLGTAGGAACAAPVLAAVEQAVAGSGYSWIANGRFKGGHITRHYGNPGGGIHAVQLEMCQSIYMDESYPFGYNEKLAGQSGPVVECMVRAALGAVRGLGPLQPPSPSPHEQSAAHR